MSKLDKSIRPERESDVDWLPVKRNSVRFDVWTPGQTSLLEKMHKEGRSYKEIAAAVNRTPKACSLQAGKMGLTNPQEPPWSDREDEIIKKLSLSGAHIVMKELNDAGHKRSLSAVQYRIQKIRTHGFANWDVARSMSVGDFKDALDSNYFAIFGEPLTNQILADHSCYSLNRINNIFSPGSSKEKIPESTKNHFWLLVHRWGIMRNAKK